MNVRFLYVYPGKTTAFQFSVEEETAWRTYRKQYPGAVLVRVEGVFPELEKKIESFELRIDNEIAVKELRYLNRQQQYLTQYERDVFAQLLTEAESMKALVNFACNLDCYRIRKNQRLEQIKPHTQYYEIGGRMPPVGCSGEYTVSACLRREGQLHGLYFPMVSDKENLIRNRFSIPFLDRKNRLELWSVSNPSLQYYLPQEGTFEEMQRLSVLLMERKHMTEHGWKKLFAAMEAERPETLMEVCFVIERSREYSLSGKNTETNTIKTAYGYLDVKGNTLLHPLPNQLVTSWLYGPLSGELAVEKRDGETEEESLDGHMLSGYEEMIRNRVMEEQRDDMAERGLAFYIHHKLLAKKVHAIRVDVEAIEGILYSKTCVESYGTLSAAEEQQVKDYIAGQFADGWGEGFEQRGIPTGEGKLYVHFYPEYGSFTLVQKEPAEELSGQELEMNL